MDHSLAKDILSSFYKEERIHTQTVVPLGGGAVAVTFRFPPYERTRSDMGHVGMSQMHEALVEGLYCAIGYAIDRQEFPIPFDIRAYIRRMAEALFVRESFTFRRMLRAGEEATLTLRVEEATMRRRYYAVLVTVDGFMRGEVECWLQADDPA